MQVNNKQPGIQNQRMGEEKIRKTRNKLQANKRVRTRLRSSGKVMGRTQREGQTVQKRLLRGA